VLIEFSGKPHEIANSMANRMQAYDNGAHSGSIDHHVRTGKVQGNGLGAFVGRHYAAPCR
jgi:hypothetical protein